MNGIGFDIHKLVKGRDLFLGGVKIPHTKGLLGHSDADVLLHALCDAILGAAGLGDIGDHFPDTNPKYKDYKSTKFVETALALIKKKKLQIENIDTIIFAQEPKLSKYKPNIRLFMAKLLKLSPKRINIKAKTMEGLGPIGGKCAIAAIALVSLK
jgi:2-C-methyl-D-erythritol 2,4-cyclodiphosphate synthase